ncbi:MAG: tRNA epoxyqueuosine(34) reductase QueG, partial [Pseudomonadota bacterium]
CDDCLAICPWNKFAEQASEVYLPRNNSVAPDLAEISTLSDPEFRARFAGSPIKRIGRDRFLRNVAVAIGNSGSKRLISAAEALASDPSPLVRQHAIWALSRLLSQEHFLMRPTADPHPDVAEEIALCRAEITAQLPSAAS